MYGRSEFEPVHIFVGLGIVAIVIMCVYGIWDDWGNDKVRSCRMTDTFLFSGNDRYDPSVKFEYEERETECDKDGCHTFYVTRRKMVYSHPDRKRVEFFCDHGYPIEENYK